MNSGYRPLQATGIVQVMPDNSWHHVRERMLSHILMKLLSAGNLFHINDMPENPIDLQRVLGNVM